MHALRLSNEPRRGPAYLTPFLSSSMRDTPTTFFCRSTNASTLTKLLFVRSEDAALPLLDEFLRTPHVLFGVLCESRSGGPVPTLFASSVIAPFPVPALLRRLLFCRPARRPLLGARVSSAPLLDFASLLSRRFVRPVAQPFFGSLFLFFFQRHG